ncbi:hypothetical protein Tco_0425784 [Tanacetum coccineum]
MLEINMGLVISKICKSEIGKGNVVTLLAEIAQEEEVGIQSTQDEFEFMDVADAYEETERVKVNCTSEDTL